MTDPPTSPGYETRDLWLKPIVYTAVGFLVVAVVVQIGMWLLFEGFAAREAGRAIRESCFEAVSQGVRTADLGGHSSTTEFTDEVISRVRSKLDAWSSL